MPLPRLRYAPVVKSYRRRRIVGVQPRGVFGTRERVKQALAACGRHINTAFRLALWIYPHPEGTRPGKAPLDYHHFSHHT